MKADWSRSRSLNFGPKNRTGPDFQALAMSVRATVGGAAVGNNTQAQQLAGDPKVSLLLSSRLHVATYLAGDPKRKEWGSPAGIALYTCVGTSGSEQKVKQIWVKQAWCKQTTNIQISVELKVYGCLLQIGLSGPSVRFPKTRTIHTFRKSHGHVTLSMNVQWPSCWVCWITCTSHIGERCCRVGHGRVGVL